MDPVRGHVFLLAGLLTATMAASGCMGAGACAASNGAQGQVSVCNRTDTFSYGRNAGFTTSTDAYTWQNTATKASVAWGSNLGMGSVSVRITDAAGVTVFTHSYTGTGQEGSTQTTAPGKAGDWTIVIELHSASGQVGLTINSAK